MRPDLAVAMVLVLAACGGPAPAPPGTPPGDAGVIAITGRERLGWDVPAGAFAEVAELRFIAYVDNTPVDLRDVVCDQSPGPAGFACTSSLPPMAAGPHVIDVAAAVDRGGLLEGPRSSPITVRLTPPGRTAERPGRQPFVTSDGVSVHRRVAATGLDDATDLAVLPDGRVLIAERGGRLRVFRDGALDSQPALALPDSDPSSEEGLLSLAIDRRFDETAHVYAFSTSGALGTLSRFSIDGDVIGARATLLDRVPVAPGRPRATLRMGPDGKLYLALDDGGDARRVGDAASYNGKVLRLNPDGTTPDDQAGHSPVYLTGFSRPGGMAWVEAAGLFWAVGSDAEGENRLMAAARGAVGRVEVRSQYLLPAGAAPSGAAVIQGGATPAFEGNLIMGTENGDLLRVAVEPSGGVARSEWLSNGGLGMVRAVAVSPDGRVFVCTPDALVLVSFN